MTYYVFIDKMIDLIPEEDHDEALADLVRFLGEDVTDVTQAFEKVLNEAFPKMLAEHFNHHPEMTFGSIFNRDGEAIFRNMRLKVTGLGKDTHDNTVYVTDLGPIIVCGDAKALED